MAEAEYSKGLDLEDFVRNATWRDLLMELVETNRIDPWDIDLAKVVDTYVDAVRKMKVLDLHIPANIMLAASVLLRMKSETMQVFAAQEEPGDGQEQLSGERVFPEVPALLPKARLQPGRKITLSELMEALNDAIKISERRETMTVQRFEPINIVIEEDDIDKKIGRAMELLKGSLDAEGLATFAQLTRYFERAEDVLLDLFVPLLFLQHAGSVNLMQEEFFGEMIISLSKGGNGA